MRRPSFLISLVVLSALLAGGSQAASAQGIFSKVKQKAKERIDSKTDQATDKALDKALDAITCVVTDQECIRKARATGHPIKVTDSKGAPVSSADSAAAISAAIADAASAAAPALDESASTGAAGNGAAASAPPGAGVWLNYDFVPGDRTIFFDDFTDDKVGDLPTHEDVTNGNVTIVDIKGKKYLHTVTGADVIIALPEALPQRFTIEVTFHRAGGNGMGLYFKIGEDDKELALRCDQGSASISGYGPNGRKEAGQEAKGIGENDFQTCRYMADGGYVKAYINEQRVGQLNGLAFTHDKQIKMEVPNADDNGTLITDIRVAEGGKPLYDALAASGRVSTHGILFATGSATIQGESTPTLKEIGDMLTAHPELKLTIEGHTDNVGSAASNQTLSEQRAAAVKQYLVTTLHIDASRLTTKGYGASKPVASNATAQGRQQNRRVELVKM